MAFDEERGDGALAGRDAVQRGPADRLGVHRCGRPPETVEGGGQVADDRRVPDLQRDAAVTVGGDEGDGPVDDDETVGHFVESAGLRVAPQLLVARDDHQDVAPAVRVQGADTAAAVEEGLVAFQGEGLSRHAAPGAVVVPVRLDAQEFVGPLRQSFEEGLVDPLRAAENPDHRGVRPRCAEPADPHERLERLGQSLLAPPFIRDPRLAGPQHPP